MVTKPQAVFNYTTHKTEVGEYITCRGEKVFVDRYIHSDGTEYHSTSFGLRPNYIALMITGRRGNTMARWYSQLYCVHTADGLVINPYFNADKGLFLRLSQLGLQDMPLVGREAKNEIHQA